MPSSYTTRNRLEKQATGENTNSWGTRLNAYTSDMVDESLDGRAAYTLSGTKTLSSANGTTDEARCRVQHITGGTGGTVTIPAVQKSYFVINEASGSVNFTAGGVQAAVPAASNLWVHCDGTDCYVQSDIAFEGVVGTLATIIWSASVTSRSIGTGSKTFTVASDKGFATGQVVRAVSDASATNYMIGTVTSYSGSTLVVNVTATGGSGTYADWTISVTGATGATGTIANVQTFTSSGTWTKPNGSITLVLVEVWGAGGGGGSGRKGAIGEVRTGGGGGGAGSYRHQFFLPADLAATVAVTIGTGGPGGTAISAGSTAGNAGTAGGDTTFGAHLTGKGGSAGTAGSNGNIAGGTGGGVFNSGAAGAGAVGGSAMFGGGAGGGASGASTGNGFAGGGSMHGGGGGGGGGSLTTGNSEGTGAAGGSPTAASGSGGAGGAALTAGTAGGDMQGGGGGGAAFGSGSGGTGGAGGRASGGGGGGAGTDTFTNSGAGGAGGAGYCRVTTW